MLRDDRWSAAEAIFAEVLPLSADARQAALDRLCGSDTELRAFVDGLLVGANRSQNDFLESPIVSHEARVRAEQIVPAGCEVLPEQIGRYQIIRKIGEGGMGVVYEARQEHPRRTIALKVITPGLTSRNLIRRFQNEAEVLGQLQHPGIAHIYEAGVAEMSGPGGATYEQPFLAMELIHGLPLHEYARHRGLGNRQRLELLARICDAVHHAHQKGVIHRDLKPANILVVDEADSSTANSALRSPAGPTDAVSRDQDSARIGQPKVLDFGVARATDSDLQTVTMRTDAGQLVGTVPYMSPEQVRGDSRELDIRSDVYALGVVLYELLAGRLPIDVRHCSIPEAVRLIQEEEPSRLSSINTIFRGDIETIVARAMEKDRAQRYASAAELAADIRRYLRDEPIIARPPSAMYQLRKFAKRNKALVGGAAAVFGTLLLGAVGMAWFALRESQQRQLAELLLEESQAARDAENVQRQLAERRFEDVRQLARIFIHDIYDEIAMLSGATQAREKIIRTAVHYLDELSSETGQEAELLNELIEGYHRLGNILGKASQANLGDTATALEVYQRALALAERLVKMKPDDPQAQSVVGSSQELVGNALRAMGRTEEAIVYLRKHLETMEALETRFPEHPDSARTVAFGHANLGRLELATGRYDEALKGFCRYEAYVAAELEKNPGDLHTMSNHSIILDRIAEIHAHMGDDEKAHELLVRSLAISEQLVAQAPQHAGYQANLASTRSNIGRNLMRLGRKEEGLQQILASRAVRESMIAADPSDARARRNLAVNDFTVADAYERLGRHEDALLHFERSRDQLKELVVADPNYIVLQRDLALGYQRTAKTLHRLNRPREALEPAGEALAMFQRLAAADRVDALAAHDEAYAYGELGMVQLALAIASDLSREEQLMQLKAARENFVRTGKLLDALEAAGRLTRDRLYEYEEMKILQADCESRLRLLEGEASVDDTSTDG